MVGWPLPAAGAVPQLVIRMSANSRQLRSFITKATPRRQPSPQRRALQLADLAVDVLIAEALLTPKPALVDLRGSGAHRDLDLTRLLRSARPYISNRRARVVHDAQGVRDDLIHNVSNAVRWHDSVTLLYELDVRLFIEPPPGKVLSRLAQQAFPAARAIGVEDMQLDSILLLAGRERRPAP
jgi:malonyl CoA-acyl carrier protein transacylase